MKDLNFCISMKDLNSKIANFFDASASSWDDNNLDIEGAQKIVSIPRISDSINNAKVLDIGCGTGVMEKPLLDARPNSIHAIDLSQNMIKEASAKFQDPKITFECCDFASIVQSNYDFIMMYNVYPHLQQRDILVDKLTKITSPNARFVIAHGAGKDKINSHHKAHAAGVSIPLKSADKEAKLWEGSFFIDTLIDTNDIYCISGTKL